MSTSLYDRDFQSWIEQTIRQLQDREFELLDIEYLEEELINLGKAEKNVLKINLTVLLANLPKLTVQGTSKNSTLIEDGYDKSMLPGFVYLQ